MPESDIVKLEVGLPACAYWTRWVCMRVCLPLSSRVVGNGLWQRPVPKISGKDVIRVGTWHETLP